MNWIKTIAVICIVLWIANWIRKVFFTKHPDYFVDKNGDKYRMNETGGKENIED
jgi:hypothetical protein